MTTPHPEAKDGTGPLQDRAAAPDGAPVPQEPPAPDGAPARQEPPAPGDATRTDGARRRNPEPPAGRPPATDPHGTPGLDAHLVVDRGTFHLDVTLNAAPGDVLALLGPNGAGKTTALRALAGLTPLTDGHLHLDGTPLAHTPPESRPVGVVFQDYLLFPHLSALDNVAFGPRCRGVRKAEARAQASTWLERMGLAAHAGAKPRSLSGGQAQRVALARALATRPRLLLLDEPLAALDARTRLEVRAQLRRHLAEFEAVSVLVTHDPLDAMVLADRLVVVEHGRVVQEGTPADIARHPRTDYIAQLVGLNLYRGRAEGHTVRLDSGPAITTTEELSGPVFVAFPPSAVTLFRDRPSAASARNLWRLEVAGLETHGDQIRADLTGELPLAADLTTVAAAELDLHPGAPVWATVKATQTHAYPA
ncbi:ATP-binding cassette domain-containing protein [Streptomyces sp. NPDC004658]|uniref:ATP-binding cassette domain-containing protein n=1 Tax=Streptomyces sp. NPDC004658 TaxID=3154672 RepID=UPI0033A81B63